MPCLRAARPIHGPASGKNNKTPPEAINTGCVPALPVFRVGRARMDLVDHRCYSALAAAEIVHALND